MKNQIYLFGLLCLISCEREVDIVLESTFEPTVYLLNSSDSNWHGKVYMVHSVLDTGNYFFNSAVVSIYSEDTQFICQLPVTSVSGHYANTFYKPEAHKTYLVKSEVNNTTLWAKDKMPGAFTVDFIDSSKIFFKGNPNFFQVQFRISDPPDTVNHYAIQMSKMVRIYERNSLGQITDSSDHSISVKIESNELALINEPSYPFHGDEILFTDQDFEGTSKSFQFGSTDVLVDQFNPDVKLLGVKISIKNISAPSYSYLTSLYEHVFYQNNPFAQPVAVQGNLGATGVFGLMNNRTFILYF